MKSGKLNIEKKSEKGMLNYAKTKVNAQNVSFYYKLSGVFDLKSFSNATFSLIERFFTTVAGSQNFFQLDFDLVRKILKSSQLHITSELEVFDAAESWISQNSRKRKELAQSLLQTVRLPLLSKAQLNSLLGDTSTICSNSKCRNVVIGVLENKENTLLSSSTRHCNDNLFGIVFSEGEKIGPRKQALTLVSGNKLRKNKVLTTINKNFARGYEAVILNGELYILANRSTKNSVSIKKYLSASDAWENQVDFDFRDRFCVCAFMSSVYVLGGDLLDSCLKFDAKSRKIEEVAKMNEARWSAACCVYQGKIVACGGYTMNYYYIDGNEYFETNISNSVEAYDSSADEWSRMPPMIEAVYKHSLVVAGNNLYVLGFTCEKYNSLSDKFVAISKPPASTELLIRSKNRAVSMAGKIFVFRAQESKVISYDVTKDEWTEEMEVEGYIKDGCCIKLPHLLQ